MFPLIIEYCIKNILKKEEEEEASPKMATLRYQQDSEIFLLTIE